MKHSALTIASCTLLTFGLFSTSASGQLLNQQSQTRQFSAGGQNNSPYAIRNNSGYGRIVNGGQQQNGYRTGNGVIRRQTYKYGTTNSSGQGYSGSSVVLPGGSGWKYQADPYGRGKIQWGTWSEWKPLNSTSQAGGPSCPLQNQSVRVLGRKSGFDGTEQRSGQRIIATGGSGSTFGDSTVRTSTAGRDRNGTGTTTNHPPSPPFFDHLADRNFERKCACRRRHHVRRLRCRQCWWPVTNRRIRSYRKKPGFFEEAGLLPSW